MGWNVAVPLPVAIGVVMEIELRQGAAAHERMLAVVADLRQSKSVPAVGAPHMWHAAVQSAGCERAALGQRCRNFIKNEGV